MTMTQPINASDSSPPLFSANPPSPMSKRDSGSSTGVSKGFDHGVSGTAGGTVEPQPPAGPSTQPDRPDIVDGTAQRYHGFLDKSPGSAAARQTYLKIFLVGSLMTIIIIFAIFPIFWGALWKTPVGRLSGWIVDFDGGLIGQGVQQALTQLPPNLGLSAIKWEIISNSRFPGGVEDLANAVLDEKVWVAVSVNQGSTSRLMASVASPNASYDGSSAITVLAVEGRNEGAYRGIITPMVQIPLTFLSKNIALQIAQRLAVGGLPGNLTSLLTASPQTVVAPVSFTVRNLAPFDQPIATGVIFVGLIFQFILALFVVMVGFGAREKSGLANTLSTTSLVLVKILSLFGMYFLLSLLYSLLSLAFNLHFTKKFGAAGFVVFWMLNYANMLATGLAVEAVITLLPIPVLPFFILLFIIANVAVCAFPIEILPPIYRYGYAMPFYNVSRGIRTVLFATKNAVPLTFGILIAWIALSCITIPLFQWFVRRHNWTSSLNAAASVPPSRGLDRGKPAREAENDTRDSEKAE